jgi:glucarate dehydratase
MRVSSWSLTTANVAYHHRELSSQVSRDGVTASVLRLETNDGLVGWGESCAGADVASVNEALRAMMPFVVGGDPWRAEAMRRDAWHRGLWQFREGTANFAWAAIDMALADICGQAAGVPVHALLGGALRDSVDYFWYLSGYDVEDLVAQARQGVARGYGTFYLKVGLDDRADVERVLAIRDAVGDARIRVDANGAWSVPQARRVLAELAPARLDFVEQPVRQVPRDMLRDLRRVVDTPVCANEGLWSEEQARERIESRVADVYCFSPFWVGSLRTFQRLGFLAHEHGAQVCKHTHGELGIAATAGQHVMLTLPAVVAGNQQTTAHMNGDIVSHPLPIAEGPTWGIPTAPGLGVSIDEERLGVAADAYARDGQYLPYRAGDS